MKSLKRSTISLAYLTASDPPYLKKKLRLCQAGPRYGLRYKSLNKKKSDSRRLINKLLF